MLHPGAVTTSRSPLIYSAFACCAMADSLASPRFFISPCLPFCSLSVGDRSALFVLSTYLPLGKPQVHLSSALSL